MEKKNKTLKEIFAEAFENYKKGDLKIAEVKWVVQYKINKS